jgi:RimJ/RimL family protein N-acetyltransferase
MSANGEFNWVDPDILAYFEEANDIEFLEEHRSLEKEFNKFFSMEWNLAKYDDLRDVWEPIITNPEPKIRVLAKTALWNVIRLRRGREEGIYKPIIAKNIKESNWDVA